MNLVKKIQENIFRHQLFGWRASTKGGSASGGKIVVGVSGGPDSVCLLDILHGLKKKYNLEIIIAHVNYNLRGKDSQKDEKIVERLAKKYHLPFEIKKIISYKLQVAKSEDYLRNIRYDFFEIIREKYKADAIAVGHNLNDQAETVLMRILRGTGLRGLGAIKFKNSKIIRPLLNIPRKEILAYLRKNKVEFRVDKTNLGTDFTRNKIRNKLLPYIVKDYNPNIEKILCRLSQSAAEDYDFVGKYSAEWLKLNKTLRVSKLEKLHPAIQKEVLRLAIEKHSPNLREIESGHIDEILKVVKSGKSKRQQISLKSLKISRVGDKLTIRKL